MIKLSQNEWPMDFDALMPCGNAAAQHGVDEYPREACGLVVVERGRHVYVPCRNTATKPTDQFRMDPEDYAAAEARGEVVGIVHSHPDVAATPSQADLVLCEASELPWHIVAVHQDLERVGPVAVESIEPSGYKAPLVGRQFVHGLLDCFTLIKDYYADLGIMLPNFEREDDWWIHGQSLYLDHYKEAGFVEAPSGLKEHDVILMQIRSPTPNHGAVYIGNTQVLHHLYGRLSSRDVYGGGLREATRLILRHKELL